MVAAYSLRHNKNCVKHFGQFFFNFVFHVSRFLSRFDKNPITDKKESMNGPVLRGASVYKIFTFNTWHSIPHLSPVQSFDSDFSTSLQEFSLCFAVFLSQQGPVSKKSRNISGLFRLPKFPLYFRNAEVLSHQTSQSFRKRVEASAFQTKWIVPELGRKTSLDFRETGPSRLNEPTLDLI